MLSNDLYTNVCDEKIWKDFKEGNKYAFEFIYKEYVNDLYNYGMQIAGDETVVENSIQDTFLDIWRNRHNLGEVTKIKYYLLKALKRKITHELRKQYKIQCEDDLTQFYDFQLEMPLEFSILSDQLSAERQKKLKEGLEQLTPRQREVVFLRFYDGLTYQEIAGILAINVDSSYNIISKAIGTLKQLVNQLGLVILFSPIT